MMYRVAVRPEALAELQRLPANLQARIGNAVEQRLAIYPDRCGKPLRGGLLGYWRLRVGDYRLVYKLSGREVTIYHLYHRHDVYRKLRDAGIG